MARTNSMWTIGAIKALNKAKGQYFFEPATLRFFDSKIEPRVYEGSGGVYFVTSEQFHGSNGSSNPRKWTVRRFYPVTGEVDTVGQFNDMDRHSAMVAAKRLARGDKADVAA
jgi:hypothetical protein